MKRLCCVILLLALMILAQNKVFAFQLDCRFKDVVDGIEKIQLIDEGLVINDDIQIPLEKTRVKCGNFGRQVRFDGSALGYQVVLKSCTTDAVLEGLLIDSINHMALDVQCYSMEPGA